MILRLEVERFGALFQKIVVEQFGDVHQQRHVDALALQHLVGVGAVAVDGLGKPSHGAPLPRQLGSNHGSYVYLGSHCSLKCLINRDFLLSMV